MHIRLFEVKIKTIHSAESAGLSELLQAPPQV